MKALITGITGQVGSYLAELLVEKSYDVFGIVRRSSTGNTSRINHLRSINLIQGDLTDPYSIDEAVKISEPDEIYNLAAQSFVPLSWKEPHLTFQINTQGFINLIQSILKYVPQARVYQASSSEMYGNSKNSFKPESPYGVSKLASHHLTSNYRTKYGLYICSGICFNHESPRRGDEFVTKKIANFAKNPFGKLRLGNLNVSRDWGFAGDYAKAMWLILQQPLPGDYEIATGETHQLSEFLEIALGKNWNEYVEKDPEYMRLNEVFTLKGNPEKIMSLGWKPEVSFEQLVKMMVRE